jgi:head-tail adaptor
VSAPPRLSRRLALQEVVRQPDNAGGYTETWVTLGFVWGELRAGSGRERTMTATSVSSVPYRIVLRALPVGAGARPKPGHRLAEGGRLFDIKAVAEYGQGGFYLVCFATEEVST